MNKPNFKELYYLCVQKLTNFPYIEEDFDALTNYELLCKVVEELNKMITNMNTQNESIIALYNAFNTLKTYIENYFENLDVQEEINKKLDNMAESGELTFLIKNYIDPFIEEQNQNINEQNQEILSFKNQTNNTINQLRNEVESIASGTPTPVNSLSEMIDTTKLYLLLTDGYVYYYDGTNWVQGWRYQATGVDGNQVYLKYEDITSTPVNFTELTHGGGSQSGSDKVYASRYKLSNCTLKEVKLAHAFSLTPNFSIFLIKKTGNNYTIEDTYNYVGESSAALTTISDIDWEIGDGEYYLGFYSSTNRSVSLNLQSYDDNSGIYQFTYDSENKTLTPDFSSSQSHYVVRCSITIEKRIYYYYTTKEEFDELEEKVNELENNGVLSYYKNEVERIKNIGVDQRDGLSFVFATDIHLRNDDDLYKMNIISECGKFADFICLNGDIIDGSATYSATEVRNLLATGVERSRNKENEVYCTIGNHEDNFYGVEEFGSTAIINNLQQTNLTQKKNRETVNDVNNPNQMWYYVDFPLYKIRVIFFNYCVAFNNSGELVTQDASNGFRIPNEEILWLRDKALRFDDKEDKEDWAVIVCSHVNPVKDENIGYINLYNVTYFSELLKAFKNGTSFTVIDPGAGYGTDNVFDFTDQGAMEVIGVFSGHSHVDCVSTSNDYGIACINTCNDLNRRTSKEGIVVTTPDTPMTVKNAPLRVDGTITTECFDYVKIDRENKLIICNRYGAGNSRTISYNII